MKHQINKEIGKRLKYKRQILRITQKQLAQELGVTPQQIQKYEKGMDAIPIFRLVKTMKIFNVNANYFINQKFFRK